MELAGCLSNDFPLGGPPPPNYFCHRIFVHRRTRGPVPPPGEFRKNTGQFCDSEILRVKISVCRGTAGTRAQSVENPPAGTPKSLQATKKRGGSPAGCTDPPPGEVGKKLTGASRTKPRQKKPSGFGARPRGGPLSARRGNGVAPFIPRNLAGMPTGEVQTCRCGKCRWSRGQGAAWEGGGGGGDPGGGCWGAGIQKKKRRVGCQENSEHGDLNEEKTPTAGNPNGL